MYLRIAVLRYNEVNSLKSQSQVALFLLGISYIYQRATDANGPSGLSARFLEIHKSLSHTDLHLHLPTQWSFDASAPTNTVVIQDKSKYIILPGGQDA